MTSDIDIYRTAQAVIKKCSSKEHPKDYADAMMSKLSEKGDTDGAIVWARIANAVDDLILQEMPKGKPH